MSLEFSPQQWNAVTTVDQHVLVSAGAGTGKTRTVVGRILYLLGVELQPPQGALEATVGRARCSLNDIAAITFTNAAAADLKKKLRDALLSAGRREDAYEIDLSRIGTIHSFCLDLLREFALQSGANPRDELVDEATSATLRSEIVRETILRVIENNEIQGLEHVLARAGLSGHGIVAAEAGQTVAPPPVADYVLQGLQRQVAQAVRADVARDLVHRHAVSD